MASKTNNEVTALQVKALTGLNHCLTAGDCQGCPYQVECACATDCNPMHKDLEALIHRLQLEKAWLIEEFRDMCAFCKWEAGPDLNPCKECLTSGKSRWQWRGINNQHFEVEQ